MATFNGWGDSWGESWVTNDPNAMAGSASFSISGSLQVASGQMHGSALFTFSATGDLTVPVVSHRRYKQYGKAYLKRDNEVLVFQSEDEKDRFIAAEEEAQQAINRAARRKVIASRPKPVETVNVQNVKQQAIERGMPVLNQWIDIDRLLQIHATLLELQDEEDIELLLL